jgi:hypothetical protein
MRCNFAGPVQTGNFAFLANLYIPTGTQVVSMAFDAVTPVPDLYVGFLHLDFMPEGDVRIDDGSVRFGRFPRDQIFALAVNLSITATSAAADITLYGDGASGAHQMNLRPETIYYACRLHAVSFWMAYAWQGTFFVDNAIVTRAAP